jgi:hypothetical protein
MKVWLVIQWSGGDGDDDKIVGVFGSKESAEAKRESMMVRVPGITPWDIAGVVEWEVQP